MSSLPTDQAELRLSESITDALTAFSQRRIRLLKLRAVAAGLIALFVTMTIVAIFDYLWWMPDLVRWSLSLIAYLATAGAVLRYGWRRADRTDLKRIARQFESADPRFREDLLSTVELADPALANGSHSFRNWLQDRTGRQMAMVDIGRLLPIDLIRPWLWTAATILFATGLLSVIPSVQFGRRIARAMLPSVAIERASLTKIRITEPSPPGGPVAAGDTIAVVASIVRAGVDGPHLEWRGDDGSGDVQTMTRRAETDSYSAIVAIGDAPIDYRIVAGDGVTLWHRLTPVPRPKVTSFSKRYVFPAYAKTPDQIVEQKHGDLEAVHGTVANLTVRMSEPCGKAEIQFVGQMKSLPMTPTDESKTAYVAEVPIQQPARYQISATGLRSGLKNPQTHPANILPINDSPPVIHWRDDIPREQIVSVSDVLSLTASVKDEFPVDSLIQEYQVNGGPITRRELTAKGDQSSIALEWDLMAHETKFNSGDVIQTWLVAIDRLEQQGESQKIELLLSDEGFAVDRYIRTDHLHDAVTTVIAWSDSISDQLKSAAMRGDTDQNIEYSLPPTEAIRTLLRDLLVTANDPADAARIELTLRAIEDLERQAHDWFAARTLLHGIDATELRPLRDAVTKQLKDSAGRRLSDARQIESYARDQMSHHVTIGLVNDATTLLDSLEKLLATELPTDRQTRHLRVADGRLAEIASRIAKYQDATAPAHQAQFSRWNEFAKRQHEVLDRAIKTPESVDQQRQAIADLAYALANGYSDRELFCQRVSIGLTNGLQALQRQTTTVAASARQIVNGLDRVKKIERSIAETDDSEKVTNLNRESQFFAQRLDSQQQQTSQLLEQTRDLHSTNPNVDLPFIADLGLMRRAIDEVSQPDFEDRADADVALHELADAFEVLQAGHDLIQWQDQLRSLADSESDPRPDARFRFANPQLFGDYVAGINWPTEQINHSAIDSNLLRRTIHVQHVDQIRRAERLLNTRRYDSDQTAPARRSLDLLETELSEYLELLQPFMQSARATLRRYAISLHEQARQAAEKVRSAIETTNSDNGSHERLTQEQKEADTETKQTMEALIDLANMLSAADTESRELARDADSALAQISKHRDRVNEAMKEDTAPAEIAEALNGLRDRLDRTADHFERAENGQDISESRQRLRQAEQELDIQKELDERSERSQAMAEAAQRDANELRKQLEQEAKKNESMRDAMSEIAQQTARAALASLKQAAQDERFVIGQLERSDPELAEQKLRWTELLRSLARELAAVEQISGTAITQTATETDLRKRLDDLQQIRQSIREAAATVEELSGDDPRRAAIIDAANEMATRIKSTLDAVETFHQSASDVATASPELTNNRQATSKRIAEQQMRQARDQQVRLANDQKRDWTKVKQNAERRVQQAARQSQSNQNAKEQLSNDAKAGESENASDEAIQRQIVQIQKRIDHANRAEDAARDSVAEAKQSMNLLGQRTDQLRKEAIAPFETSNPAAEATVRLTKNAADQLNKILQDVKQITNLSEAKESLRVPDYVANEVTDQQQRIRDEIDDIGNELRRAALSEQRLGRKEASQEIADSATRIKQIASSSADQATELIKQSGQNADAATAAVDQVAQTEQQLTGEANRLAQLLGQSSPEPGQPSNEPSDDQSNRAEQLARTLDELDQANQQMGESDSELSAGEASDTLQQAMDDSARQAAKERRQQISPSDGDAKPPSEDTETSSAGNNPFSGTPGGEASEEGSISIAETDRIGADWGQLRLRRPGDSSGIQRTRVPDRYRLQIEAYFRAIAERSAGGER